MSRIVSLLARTTAGALERVRLTPADRLFGRAVIHATASVVAPIAGATSTVATREAGYWSERQATNHIPDPSSAIAAMWAGELTVAATTEILANHGIPLDLLAGPEGNKWTYYWQQIVRHHRPRLSSEQALDLWRQHWLTSDECRAILAHHGLTYPGDRDLLMRERGWFDLGTATDLWRQGLLTDIEYGSAIRRAGIGDVDAGNLLLTQRGTAPLSEWVVWWSSGRVDDATMQARWAREGVTDPQQVGFLLDSYEREPWAQAVDAWRLGRRTDAELQDVANQHGYEPAVVQQLVHVDTPLAVGEAVALGWRSAGGYGQEVSASLARAGLDDPERRNAYLDLQRPLPTLADVQRFAGRAAFDGDLAQRWQLDAGMPTQYMDLAVWQGADWLPRQVGQPAAASDWPALATAYWRSQVQILSPRQAIEALRRLSGGRHQRFAATIDGIQEFTPNDLFNVYHAHGWSPVHARWDRALATPELPIRDIRRRYLLDPGWRAHAAGHLRRLGYLPADATAILDTIDVARTWRDQAPIRRLEDRARTLAYNAIHQGYLIGSYRDDQAQEALIALGLDTRAISFTLIGWQAEVNQAAAKEIVGRIKRGYMGGEFNVAEVQLALNNAHIQPARAALYVQQWAVQRTWTRRAATSAQILRWVARGILAPAVAVVRLGNLGWTAPDVALMLADAEGSLLKLEAAQVAAGERTRQKAQRQLAATIQAHGRAVSAAQKQLRRITPLSHLKTWLVDGIASEEWVRARLAEMGYPVLAIDAYIAEWRHNKGRQGPEVLGGSATPPLAPESAPGPPPATTIQGGTPTIPPNEGQ